jgi:hypothetical protein
MADFIWEEWIASLGRWQAPDKGEVRPTPAFRLLRVGAEYCLIELWIVGLSGKYCIFREAHNPLTTLLEMRDQA